MLSSETILESETIILGIDPGTNVMGYGIISTHSKHLKLIQYGVMHISKYDKEDHALRLKKIYDRTSQLIEEYTPDIVAIEAPFYGKNIQSMLKLGRAQGVALAAALGRGIPVVEYAPKKIKQSVTGNGNASKEQVSHMVMRILNIVQQPELFDATDALSVALCHFYQGKGVFSKSSGSTWNDFVQKNPNRILK